jgi:hypothetical protein
MFDIIFNEKLLYAFVTLIILDYLFISFIINEDYKKIMKDS